MKRLILTFLIFHIAMSLPAADFWQRVETPNGGSVSNIIKTADGTYYAYSGGLFRSTDLINWTGYFQVFKDDTCTMDFRAFPWGYTQIIADQNDVFLYFYCGGDMAKLIPPDDTLRYYKAQSTWPRFYPKAIVKSTMGTYWSIGQHYVHYSTDTMKTWTRDTLFPMVETHSIYSIEISPEDELFVLYNGYLCIRHVDSTEYIKVEDYGTGDLTCVYFGEDSYIGGTGRNGLLFTTDKGRHWENMQSYTSRNYIYTVLRSRNNTLFVGTEDEGLYYSVDNGITWNLDMNFLFMEINKIKYIDDRLWLCTADGLYYSDNDGALWTKLEHGPGIRKGNMQTMTKNGQYILSSGYALYYTDKIGNELRNFNISGNIKFYWVRSGANALWAVDHYYYFLYRSKDNGLSWQQMSYGDDDSYFVLPYYCENHMTFDSLGRIIVYTDYDNSGNNIYCSSDAGDSWFPYMPESEISSWFNSRVISSDDNEFVYYSEDSLIYSLDYGNTWSSVPNRPELANESVGDCIIHNKHIYIGSIEKGFYQYDIDKKEWKIINNGLQRNDYDVDENLSYNIRSICRVNNDLYITTFFGIYKMAIGDTVWTDMSEDNIFGMANYIKWLPDGHIYFSSTAGLWRSTEKFISVEDQPAPPPASPELTIYPNPAQTTARLSLPATPIDRVELYDLEGRQAGNAGVQYDGAFPVVNVEGLPAGVYIVQVSSGGRLFSARLVVAHG